MPEFYELTSDHLRLIEISLDFVLWKITKLKQELLNTCFAPIKKLLYKLNNKV